MEVGQVIGKGRGPQRQPKNRRKTTEISSCVTVTLYCKSHQVTALFKPFHGFPSLSLRGRDKSSFKYLHNSHTHTRLTHSFSPLWPYCPCCFLQHSLYAGCFLYWNILLLDLCIANDLNSFTLHSNATFPANPFKAVLPPAHSICPILNFILHFYKLIVSNHSPHQNKAS